MDNVINKIMTMSLIKKCVLNGIAALLVGILCLYTTPLSSSTNTNATILMNLNVLFTQLTMLLYLFAFFVLPLFFGGHYIWSLIKYVTKSTDKNINHLAVTLEILMEIFYFGSFWFIGYFYVQYYLPI